MGSLILQVISIALFAGITAAVAYFGGSALIGGGGKAKASGIISQGQQIEGTLGMYAASTPGYPSSLTPLITGNYLKQIPTVPADLGGADWTYNGGAYAVAPIGSGDASETVCREVNSQRDGIDAESVTLTAGSLPTVSDAVDAARGTFGCGATDVSAGPFAVYYRVR